MLGFVSSSWPLTSPSTFTPARTRGDLSCAVGYNPTLPHTFSCCNCSSSGRRELFQRVPGCLRHICYPFLSTGEIRDFHRIASVTLGGGGGAGGRRPGRRGAYLEVSGALEGLPAHGTHVDALPAVHLLAVLQQHGGRREAAATLHALVQPGLLLGRPALGQAGRDVSDLRRGRKPRALLHGCGSQQSDRGTLRHRHTQPRASSVTLGGAAGTQASYLTGPLSHSGQSLENGTRFRTHDLPGANSAPT